MRNERILGGFLAASLVLFSGCSRYDETALATVRKNRNDLMICVEQAFARNPNAKGEVELAFEIFPDGSVHRFAVLKNETGDLLLADCIRDKAPLWKFPAPPSGRPEQFRYRMNVHT
ncbi:MAG: AgmX/PglI C-terminal domain-containing protein [Myxococcales bacterium]|jgi:hypothetical protein|nr:AgmX/PglI C-terminal domain-containing protein [Myxococcales bacterium]